MSIFLLLILILQDFVLSSSEDTPYPTSIKHKQDSEYVIKIQNFSPGCFCLLGHYQIPVISEDKMYDSFFFFRFISYTQLYDDFYYNYYYMTLIIY
jgi:hypothetical protein